MPNSSLEPDKIRELTEKAVNDARNDTYSSPSQEDKFDRTFSAIFTLGLSEVAKTALDGGFDLIDGGESTRHEAKQKEEADKIYNEVWNDTVRHDAIKGK